MKHILILSMLIFLWVGLAGCGDDNDDDDDDDDNNNDSSDLDVDSDSDGDADGDGDSDSDSDSDDIWQPPPETTWQWQLLETIDTSFDVEMYDIDLFEVDQEVIDQLHADGRIVICYFSAGSMEDWRDDADQYPQEAIGDELDGWPGEFWIDVTDETVRSIIQTRMDLAVEKKCDGVEPDNVDGYANENGLGLTAEDQLDFNMFLADEAHERGLSVGLKNDLDQIEQLEPYFDWALNEECAAYGECEAILPFINAGKAVFHTEYVDDEADGSDLAADVCDDPTIDQFSTLIKTWDLTSWYLTCDL